MSTVVGLSYRDLRKKNLSFSPNESKKKNA
jgi:hypothetical protein